MRFTGQQQQQQDIGLGDAITLENQQNQDNGMTIEMKAMNDSKGLAQDINKSTISKKSRPGSSNNSSSKKNNSKGFHNSKGF